MSFSQQRKQEIVEHEYRSACCRRALIQGVLAARGTVRDDGVVEYRVEKEAYADFTTRLIEEFYGRSPELLRPTGGGRCLILRFESRAAARYLGGLDAGDTSFFTGRCEGCHQAFLRGLFLAGGRLSDPEKQYCLEFSFGKRSDSLLKFFQERDLSIRQAIRRGAPVLYTRSSSVVEDFFAHAGMNSVTFAVINRKIETDFRSGANRLANCETGNISKAVLASMRQLTLLRELEAAHLLASLPPELEYTARLRLEHSDLSLSQLAALAVPPISKPGLSHRLCRIATIGEELLRQHVTRRPKTTT